MDEEYILKTRIDHLRKDLIFQLDFLKNPECFNFEIFRKSVEELEESLKTFEELGLYDVV